MSNLPKKALKNEIDLVAGLKKVWIDYCSKRDYPCGEEDTDAIIGIVADLMSSFVMERHIVGMDLDDAIHLAIKYLCLGTGDTKKQKIIDLLTPTEFAEAYAIDDTSFPDHLTVASYDGHDLNIVVHKWDDLLKKYDAAIELVASWNHGTGFDDQESERLLRDAWLEVAG